MVELPLDDAATRYEQIAEQVNSIKFGLDTSELDGRVADILLANAEGLQEFTGRCAEVLMEQAGYVRQQHQADEQLRDAPKPADVRELEAKAKQLAMKAHYSVNPRAQSMAETAARAAAEKRLEREIALARHTAAAERHKPLLKMEPPALPNLGGVPGTVAGGYGDHDGNPQIGNLNPQQTTPGSGNPDTGDVDTPLPGETFTPLPGPTTTTPDTGVNTETSSDMMGGATPQQAMMGTPQSGTQQPTMPSMSGTGTAAQGVNPNGMLSSSPSPRFGPDGKRRKDKDRDQPGLDLSSGGVIGAVPMSTGGVDRGVSLSGVTTDKDTTGRVGQTNLSAGGGKPGDGGNNAPRGNMMRGGMMPMGGMGSGAQGGSNVKSKADNPILSAIKDRYLHGFDSLKEGVEGGMVGRDTSEAPSLDGTDQFLDDGKPKTDNTSGA